MNKAWRNFLSSHLKSKEESWLLFLQLSRLATWWFWMWRSSCQPWSISSPGRLTGSPALTMYLKTPILPSLFPFSRLLSSYSRLSMEQSKTIWERKMLLSLDLLSWPWQHLDLESWFTSLIHTTSSTLPFFWDFCKVKVTLCCRSRDTQWLLLPSLQRCSST